MNSATGILAFRGIAPLSISLSIMLTVYSTLLYLEILMPSKKKANWEQKGTSSIYIFKPILLI